MKVIRVNSWRGFVNAIQKVRREHGTYRRELPDGTKFEKEVGILFRGHADARWELETTLERVTSDRINVREYANLAAAQVFEIESFTGTSWNIPSRPAYERKIRRESSTFKVYLPFYNYLVYLRHHGFPSPLLDWTESPYVAAHFALSGSRSKSAAVFCYIERPELIKGGSGGDPMITVKGPFVRTHKRHFAQKAWYTIATKWDYVDEVHNFCPHQRVFAKGTAKQDLLVKIVLSKRAMREGLAALTDYNINDFTLFQTEDSLIHALSERAFRSLRI